MSVVRVQGQHVFQANAALLLVIEYGAEPEPGRDAGLILLDDPQQCLAGLLALTGFSSGNPCS